MTGRQNFPAPKRQQVAHPKGAEPTRRDAVMATPTTDALVLQQAIENPDVSPPGAILALQRLVGNRAVTGVVQARLVVGAAGDRYEQEADRVAEHVMSMPAEGAGRTSPATAGAQPVQRQPEEEEEVQTKPLVQLQAEEEEEVQTKPLVQLQAEEEEEVQTKPLVQLQAEEEEELQTKPLVQLQAEEEEEVQTKPLVQLQAEEEEEVQTKPLVQLQAEEEEELQTMPLVQLQAEEEEELQTKPLVQRRAEGGFEASGALEERLTTLRGSGSPLPGDVRAFMEPRFGADFGDVRVHADGESGDLNRHLGAQAFTHGEDVYFGAGRYQPDSNAGKQLLAHELTHTLQQGATNRIAGWWPKGHRMITELAFQQGADTFGKYYSKDAKNYLVDRSPDIDFIPDGFKTMNQGIAKSKKQLKEYRRLLSSIKPVDRRRGRKMYDDNELHIREESYMDNHGEGGYYKKPGASTNAGVTTKFMEKAVGLWKSKNPLQSLSILSDGVHQAADRGSHGEGNPFEGHDVRLKLNEEPWEKEHYNPTWEPDNGDVNKKGLVMGVGHVEWLLSRFKDAIGLKKGEKVKTNSFVEFFKPKRRLWLGHVIPVKSSGLGGLFTKIPGKSGAWRLKGFKQIFTDQMKDQSIAAAYERARTGGGLGAQTGSQPLANPQLIEELTKVLKQKK